MTRYEIVEILGRNKEVEKIARHYNTFAKEDLCQYVYLYLLTKVDDEKITELYQTKQLKQYITGIIHRQVISTKSDYVRMYKQIGLSIENEDENELKYVYKLEYIPEEEAHQLENEFYEYINTLSDEEKDIMYILMQKVSERGEDIRMWCSKYGKTHEDYSKLMIEVKRKTRVHFGREPEQITRYEEGRKINVYKNGKLIHIYNSINECYADLIPKGFDKIGIYYALKGKIATHKGYKFFWV